MCNSVGEGLWSGQDGIDIFPCSSLLSTTLWTLEMAQEKEN